MRARTRLTVTTLGVLVTAGLAVGVAQAPDGTTPAAAPAADPAVAATARLTTLEAQADAAGIAAQKADEAVLQDRTAATEAAAAQAHSALVSLAQRQEPQLAAIADVIGADTVANGGEEQPTADAAASSGSSKAVSALNFAKKQIGKPYRYAGSGLGSYDCSGLTMRAYSSAAKVGIGGHGATKQYNQAKKQHRLVSYKNARRGDLIFYGRPGAVYHVAIYAGNGRMVEAPYPGKRVREVSVRSSGRLSQVARPAG